MGGRIQKVYITETNRYTSQRQTDTRVYFRRGDILRMSTSGGRTHSESLHHSGKQIQKSASDEGHTQNVHIRWEDTIRMVVGHIQNVYMRTDLFKMSVSGGPLGTTPLT